MNWELVTTIAWIYLVINTAILVLTAVVRPKQFWSSGAAVIVMGSFVVLIAGLPLMLYFFCEGFIQDYRSRRRMAALLAERRAEVEAMAALGRIVRSLRIELVAGDAAIEADLLFTLRPRRPLLARVYARTPDRPAATPTAPAPP